MVKAMLSLGCAVLLAQVLVAQGQPRSSTSESTVTAKVDRIDRFSRTLTLRRDNNVMQMITVDPSEKLFDELKTGDRVTVRYTDSVVVQVRPGASLSLPRDTTGDAQKANDQVVQQLKTIVTIDTIDPDGQYVIYRTEDGLKAMRAVADKKLLQGIRQGDRVEVTLTRERAVSIQRAK
jgi:Cu/Ag efflux protein CusF